MPEDFLGFLKESLSRHNEISVYITSLHVTTDVEEMETATLATEQVSRILYIHYTPRIMHVRALIYFVVVWYSI